MSIELDEVVVKNVSDDVLELLAACVQKGEFHNTFGYPYCSVVPVQT